MVSKFESDWVLADIPSIAPEKNGLFHYIWVTPVYHPSVWFGLFGAPAMFQTTHRQNPPPT